MKKIIFLIIIFLFIFNIYPTYSEEEIEIIGIDHNRGIIAKAREFSVYCGDLILNQIDQTFLFLEKEIEKRQKIVEEQIESRKENFIEKLTDKIKASFSEFIESLFNKKEKIINP
jgi:hypothetical protein